MKYKPYPKYKDSGVEWLGEIPEGWEVRKIGACMNVLAGFPFHSDDFCSEGIPVIRMSDFSNGSIFIENAKRVIPAVVQEKAYAKPNDILVGLSGSLTNFALVKKTNIPVAINQRVGIFRANNSVFYKFFYWLIQSPVFLEQISASLPETTIVNVGMNTLSSCKVGICCFSTQESIASFLDTATARIDSLVAEYEDLIALLKEKRQALISHAITRGLSELISPNDKEFGKWALPVKFVDSGVEWLGEIPEGWGKTKLKRLTTVISKGTTPSTEGASIESEGPVRFLKAENLCNDSIHFVPEFFISDKTNELLCRSRLQAHDVLFVIAGATIGKVAILPKEFLPSNTNQAVCFIRLHTGYEPKFIWFYLRSNSIRNAIDMKSVQSAQPNISMEEIGNFELALPSSSEQKAIFAFLDKESSKLDALVSEAEGAIELLKERRAALITSVVTGKINVETVV